MSPGLLHVEVAEHEFEAESYNGHPLMSILVDHDDWAQVTIAQVHENDLDKFTDHL
jgi:hypothetical protein